MSILQIAVGALNPWLVPMLTAVMTAASGGNLSDILKASALVAVNEIVWFGVGEITAGLKAGTWASNFVDHAESTLIHGVAGGGLSCLEGGNFKDGFLAAAVGEACAGTVNNIHTTQNSYVNVLERVSANAIVGGTAAALGGGSFWSGAKTGAFEQLFNDEQDHILSLLDDMATGASVGAMTGAMIGGEDGAIAGTCLEPGGGTLAGGFVGATIGGFVGGVAGAVGTLATDLATVFRSTEKGSLGTPRDAQKKNDREQGPREIERIDGPRGNVPESQWHAHGKNGGGINQDGTFHDGDPGFSRKSVDWLRGHGWNI